MGILTNISGIFAEAILSKNVSKIDMYLQYLEEDSTTSISSKTYKLFKDQKSASEQSYKQHLKSEVISGIKAAVLSNDFQTYSKLAKYAPYSFGTELLSLAIRANHYEFFRLLYDKAVAEKIEEYSNYSNKHNTFSIFYPSLAKNRLNSEYSRESFSDTKYYPIKYLLEALHAGSEETYSKLVAWGKEINLFTPENLDFPSANELLTNIIKYRTLENLKEILEIPIFKSYLLKSTNIFEDLITSPNLQKIAYLCKDVPESNHRIKKAIMTHFKESLCSNNLTEETIKFMFKLIGKENTSQLYHELFGSSVSIKTTPTWADSEILENQLQLLLIMEKNLRTKDKSELTQSEVEKQISEFSVYCTTFACQLFLLPSEYLYFASKFKQLENNVNYDKVVNIFVKCAYEQTPYTFAYFIASAKLVAEKVDFNTFEAFIKKMNTSKLSKDLFKTYGSVQKFINVLISLKKNDIPLEHYKSVCDNEKTKQMLMDGFITSEDDLKSLEAIVPKVAKLLKF